MSDNLPEPLGQHRYLTPNQLRALQPLINFINRKPSDPIRGPGIIDVEFEVNDTTPQQLRQAGDGGLTPDEIYMIRKHLGLE
jgi:hypothetical protein